MNHETFFENFELLADASNGVQKLRELILQLAVKGKLVPQDPNEEPTSVLFEKIIVEKERLIKEKKLKKSQKLPKIKKDEIPFEIPKTWKWARLNDVGDWGAGGAQPNISRQKIIHTVAPLPPYEEQKQIVAKVDQLMILCDELEVCQQKKYEQRINLNNAALDKLLTAPTPEEFVQH